MNNPISKGEWGTAFGVAVGLSLLLSLPYILGYTLSEQGISFTGILMNPEDSQSYFAKMLQGYNGRWLYTIPFTLEEHDPAFLGVFYLALGHGARILGLSLEGMWHVTRFLASVILFITAFGFISVFLPERKERWAAYLIAILGSGLGWLLFLFKQPYWLGAFPIDFKMPEAHLFFSALTFPHVAIGTSLVMASLLLVRFAIKSEGGAWKYASIGGIANLLIGLVYPFLIYLVALAAGIYLLSRVIRDRQIFWRDIGSLALMFFIPLPLYIYYLYTHQVNEVFQAWSDQAVTSSPPVPHYFVAFGLLLIFALLPFFSKKPKDSTRVPTLLLWSWIIAAALLIYAPINPQRRFVQGIQVPLSILAVTGLYHVLVPWLLGTRIARWLLAKPRYTHSGLERLFIVAVIALLTLSNLYVLASMSITAAIQQPYPFFREIDELTAVEWLKSSEEPSSSVLSAYETGNYVAARAGNRVMVGHWAETVSWAEKIELVEEFYSSETSHQQRKKIMDQNAVTFVWFGEIEKSLGEFDPNSADYLQMVFSEGKVSIYYYNAQD